MSAAAAAAIPISSVVAGLQTVELAVEPLGGHEGVVGAYLGDCPVVEDDDEVGGVDGREAM